MGVEQVVLFNRIMVRLPWVEDALGLFFIALLGDGLFVEKSEWEESCGVTSVKNTYWIPVVLYDNFQRHGWGCWFKVCVGSLRQNVIDKNGVWEYGCWMMWCGQRVCAGEYTVGGVNRAKKWDIQCGCPTSIQCGLRVHWGDFQTLGKTWFQGHIGRLSDIWSFRAVGVIMDRNIKQGREIK